MTGWEGGLEKRFLYQYYCSFRLIGQTAKWLYKLWSPRALRRCFRDVHTLVTLVHLTCPPACGLYLPELPPAGDEAIFTHPLDDLTWR